MQKKNAPVLPIVGIVAVLSVLFVMNATGGKINLSKIFAAKEKPEMGDTSNVTSDQTKDLLKSQVGVANASPEPESPVASTSTSVPETPTIFIPKAKRTVEKPNSTITSGHWYKEGSHVEVERKKIAAGQKVPSESGSE